jgi:NAD(P)-dependent dehydrogenase (short-subunit alcohol dehydrogenase family)
MPAEQRTALVTGGSGGLGEAIARALHDAGHTVLIVHSPGNASIGAWLKTQAGEGYDFAAYGADVADHASLPGTGRPHSQQTVIASTSWSTTRASRAMLRSAS